MIFSFRINDILLSLGTTFIYLFIFIANLVAVLYPVFSYTYTYSKCIYFIPFNVGILMNHTGYL